MSHLQIISLFKNKSAAEVTADEIEFIVEFLEEHPELIDMLGGKTVVDHFLQAARETEAPAVNESPEAIESLYEVPARPWIFRITALLILLLVGSIAWFGLNQAGINIKDKPKKVDQADATSGEPSSTPEILSQKETEPKDDLWHGWKIETADGSPVPFQSDWIFSDQGKPTSRLVPRTKGRLTTFSIQRRVKKDDWLALHLETVEASAKPGLIEISINGDLYNCIPSPAAKEKDPYLLPLHDYEDQQLDLKLTFSPGSDQEELQWNQLRFFQHPKSTKWVPLEVVDIRSQAGTELTIGENKIITASRGGPGIETYVAQGTTGLSHVTAFRLEAFPEPGVTTTRRMRNRKWNYMDTSFVLSSFRVMTAASERKKMTGRYVKLMTNEDRSYLSLAEVQVFSGEENVALQGKATQSMPDNKMGAAMAIDNRLTADGYRTEDGKYARSMVRTRGKNGPAWWQVDLGKTCDIDRIVVHSPTNYSQRMNPFYVMVLNDSGDPTNDLVWESELIQQPPSPSVELTDSDSKRLIVDTAETDQLDYEHMVQDSLLSTPTGWNLPEYFQRTQQAVFTLREAAKSGPSGFVLQLGHHMHSRAPTLGRFRLSVTNDQPPFQFAPPGTIVWSHDQQLASKIVAQTAQAPDQPVASPQARSQAVREAAQQAAAARDAKIKAAAEKATAEKAMTNKRTAQIKAAEIQAAEAARLAREIADQDRRLAQQEASEARRIAQQQRLEALRKDQQKRQEALRKDREKRAADARKRAEELAARRKAEAKRREEDAKRRAEEAKKRAEQEAARRKADAKRREEEAKKRADEAKKRAEEEAARKKAEAAKKSSN